MSEVNIFFSSLKFTLAGSGWWEEWGSIPFADRG